MKRSCLQIDKQQTAFYKLFILQQTFSLLIFKSSCICKRKCTNDCHGNWSITNSAIAVNEINTIFIVTNPLLFWLLTQLFLQIV